MRRLLSILVLMVLVLGPAIPAGALALGWTRGDVARLPACCRRGGKHHCALDRERSQGGESTIGANETCPFGPQAMAATAPSVSAVLLAGADEAQFASVLRVVRGAAEFAVLAVRRSEPMRGPPVFQN